jgi:hypothetical protein
VVGQGIFKVFKYLDGTFKALSPALGKRDPGSVVAQAWVPPDSSSEGRERLLVGTSDGEVLLLEVRWWGAYGGCLDRRMGHGWEGQWAG